MCIINCHTTGLIDIKLRVYSPRFFLLSESISLLSVISSVALLILMYSPDCTVTRLIHRGKIFVI